MKRALIALVLLGSCLPSRREAIPTSPAPLPKARTRTPVVGDGSGKQVTLRHILDLLQGCQPLPREADSVPPMPGRLPATCTMVPKRPKPGG